MLHTIVKLLRLYITRVKFEKKRTVRTDVIVSEFIY